MRIAGIEKLSVQDYPNHISAIIFTQGCNLKCPFCHNSSLIPFDSNNLLNEEEILDFLNKRKGLLDGVTITGGEPTLQSDLKDFIKKLKNMGYDIKLDTNGLNYKVLKDLIDEKLVDYVAMDIKNSLDKYNKTSGVRDIVTGNILGSIDLLKHSDIDYEFRTTVINEHHTIEDIYKIIEIIGDSKYYLQNFRSGDSVVDKTLTPLPDEKLNMWNELLTEYPNVYIRGIEKKKEVIKNV